MAMADRMDNLNNGVQTNFLSRIDFKKNRQAMMNMQNMGDNNTEMSLMTSEQRLSTYANMSGKNSPDIQITKMQSSTKQNSGAKQKSNPYLNNLFSSANVEISPLPLKTIVTNPKCTNQGTPNRPDLEKFFGRQSLVDDYNDSLANINSTNGGGKPHRKNT